MAQGISGEGSLPQRDNDPVLRLIVHYFAPANLMHMQKAKLAEELSKRGKLSGRKQIQHAIYFRLWLALLYVVCEELDHETESQILTRPNDFLELWSKLKIVLEIFKTHRDSLRVFRNGQFHFQDSPDKMAQFLMSKPDRIEWAEVLHKSISEFFSEYRILCAVEYTLSGRTSELRRLIRGEPGGSELVH